MGTLASSPRSLEGRGSSGWGGGGPVGPPGREAEPVSVCASRALGVTRGGPGRAGSSGREGTVRGDEGTWAAGAVGAPRGSLWRRTEQSGQHPRP